MLANFFSLNVATANIWILMPIINIPLVFYACLSIILSNKYKLGRIGLQVQKSNKNFTSSKFYWEIIIVFFLWMLVGSLINFYYFLRYPIVIPNELFLASPFIITGSVLIGIFFIQLLLFPELSFREFLIAGIGMIFLLSPLLFFIQTIIYPNTPNSFDTLINILYPENTSPFIFFIITNLFFFITFCIGLFFIIFGIYQFFKLRKQKVLLFSGIGFLTIFLPLLYFLIEIFSHFKIPTLSISENPANLITPITMGYFLVILIIGLFLFIIGLIQQIKINKL